FAPEEERQTPCELEVADRVHGAGREVGRWRAGFGAIQKLRAREDRHQALLDTRLEAALLPALRVELERGRNVLVRHGPAVRAARETREDLGGAGLFAALV